jgi:L,D-peptidoglycan transpeptidase YkuD (ErfK/YbiS/YcfS/YnhG family)
MTNSGHDQVQSYGSFSRRKLFRGVLSTGALAAGVSVDPALAAKKGSAKKNAAGVVVPAASRQLILALADNWSSTGVTIGTFERKTGGAWRPTEREWLGRVGQRGLAWGRGLHPHKLMPADASDKVEGDRKAPVGVFDLGMVFGYAQDVERHPKLAYLQVTDRDLLVEDPKSSLYNRHVRLDQPAATAWEKANAMELVDPAHELKVFVHHNSRPAPVPGKGSAILLHIDRGPASTTFGCTSMPRQDMFATVAWLNPDHRPLFALLPRSLHAEVAQAWGLPPAG